MNNSNLTPDEERVLRKLLAKQKRKTRRKPNSRRVESLLAKDGVAEVILFLILVVVFLGYISR